MGLGKNLRLVSELVNSVSMDKVSANDDKWGGGGVAEKSANKVSAKNGEAKSTPLPKSPASPPFTIEFPASPTLALFNESSAFDSTTFRLEGDNETVMNKNTMKRVPFREGDSLLVEIPSHFPFPNETGLDRSKSKIEDTSVGTAPGCVPS